MARRTSLTVWLYDTAMGAAAGEVRLKDLQQQKAVSVLDAVTITWVPGADEPRVGHLRHSTAGAAAKGSALGALVGALFLAPVVGAAAGAGIAGLAQKVRGSGIDDGFLEELRSSLSPGTSALLVLAGDADLDIVRPFVERGLARGDVRLMHAWLSDDAPEALHALVEDASPGDDPA
ncbi:MAG TPA: DUF1269 domain-containing protein [Nocardioides sp.]|uniref:DUF1269 domain-containing protein n=1 Tax=Nocardioides sp. TaxID=35761 RepID=UPI002E33978A|nr:DUF1269 domain-containing protein [Nocardioides sp.]HEX5087923.1 DUF1269 domain-containing protein [Nocardioides sp.]